jgi:hypothetical protein
MKANAELGGITKMISAQTQKLWMSGVVTASAVALCWLVAFAGNLNLLAAFFLTPYIMPVVQSLDSVTRLYVFVAAPLVQFSLYGFVLGRAWLRGRLGTAAMVLAGVHIVAIIVCYLITASYI